MNEVMMKVLANLFYNLPYNAGMKSEKSGRTFQYVAQALTACHKASYVAMWGDRLSPTIAITQHGLEVLAHHACPRRFKSHPDLDHYYRNNPL